MKLLKSRSNSLNEDFHYHFIYAFTIYIIQGVFYIYDVKMKNSGVDFPNSIKFGTNNLETRSFSNLAEIWHGYVLR